MISRNVKYVLKTSALNFMNNIFASATAFGTYPFNYFR